MLVRLVHDPYGLFSGQASRVQHASRLRQTFEEIDALLSAGDHGTQECSTYIVDSVLWRQFASYRQMSGVTVEEYLPRLLIAEKFGPPPPGWLTNDLIIESQLLECRLGELVAGKWDETMVEWLLPGGRKAGTVADWMKLAYEAPRLDNACLPDEVRQVLWQQLEARAQGPLKVHELQAAQEAWSASTTPRDFATRALRTPAFLPFETSNPDSAFYGHGSSPDAGRLHGLPLVFPLPRQLHAQVSERFVRALRRGCLEKRSLAESVLSLNAVWDGLVDELRHWLNVHPDALTETAAEHLESLPGSETGELAELIQRFRPREAPHEWEALDGIDKWMTEYTAYIQSAFCRRVLPEAWVRDPAAGFSRWVTQNITVAFNHEEYGYSCVARGVREHLKQGRPVILVLIDAMAFHLVDVLVTELSAALSEQPSSIRPVFVPVPTLTEVCKAPVLTGLRPDQCTKPLEELLPEAYGLDPQQVLLVESWNDPARVVVKASHRLLVYRENALDDRLGELKSYTDLLDEFGRICQRVCERVTTWVKDFTYVTPTRPVVVVTGDHGFTYGPPPDSHGETAAALGRHVRCVAVDDEESVTQPKGSVALLKRELFHLSKSYIAATSRKFGHSTLSGWVMQHGGLLPEEVIVPLATWLAGDAYVVYPTVSIPGDAVRSPGTWQFDVDLRNDSGVALAGIQVAVQIPGASSEWAKTVPVLAARQHAKMAVTLKGPDVSAAEELLIRVMTRLQTRSGGLSERRDEEFHVPRKLQLMERTEGQEEFEGMF